jgi:hypothetical protein
LGKTNNNGTGETKMTTKKEIIQSVYESLKSRELHPTGKFDKAGRWYAKNGDLIDVREPTRAWPYSEMTACRTKKYVKAVCEKFGCETEAELRKSV